ARSSRPTRRSAGCTRAAAMSPGLAPSRASISTANGSPNWSSARSTASSCPTTPGCRTPGLDQIVGHLADQAVGHRLGRGEPAVPVEVGTDLLHGLPGVLGGEFGDAPLG